MSSEKNRGVFSSLIDKLNNFSFSKKAKQDTQSSKSSKTAADYIHENEMRLRSYSVPTRNTLVKPNQSRKLRTESETESYVFEKVKPKTKPICLRYGTFGLNVNEDQTTNVWTEPAENVLHLEPLEMRSRTFSMPTQNTYRKPEKQFLKRMHVDNKEVESEKDIFGKHTLSNTRGGFPDKPYYLKDKLSDWEFKYTNFKTLDYLLEDEMRTRTSSMPTRSTYNKPFVHDLRRSHQDLYSRVNEGIPTVRSFEINTRGKIIKRSASRSTKSSNSVHSVEEDIHHQICVTLSRNPSCHSTDGYCFGSPIDRPEVFRVFVKGIAGVGKTALTQQFLTTQYLGGFDTSTDGETEKTVNVLLNGEETALAFVEQTEEDLDDDINDTVAAYLIVYACDDRASFDRAVDTLYNLRQKQHREDVIFFVGNKSDLVRSRCVTAEEAKAVAMTYDCKFVETSVVLNVKVDELLVGIVKQLRIRSSEAADDKSAGCASSSKSLLNKIFRKDNLSKSCENLYA